MKFVKEEWVKFVIITLIILSAIVSIYEDQTFTEKKEISLDGVFTKENVPNDCIGVYEETTEEFTCFNYQIKS